MRLALVFAILALSATLSMAQERPNTILVLDASGSMWGQIDGVNKIVIARDVVGRLLADFPEDENLGLTVYGHRRRGDCTDIETIVAPATGTAGAIAEAVNGVNPRGKTPMTDAVIAAAEALRYTEERATVILVSDGIETCNPDPCAAARALEEAGVDFTAHVVGFDVADDPEALAQMRCMAEETGGIFRTASNAEELGEALAVVAEPEYSVAFIATEGPDGPQITEGIGWDIGQTETGPWLFQGAAGAEQTVDGIPAGTLFVRVTRAADGATAERSLAIDATTPDTVVLVLPELPPEPVTLSAIAVEEGSGQRITEGLVWTITGEDGAALVDHAAGAGASADVLPGRYRVEVLRITDEEGAEADVVTDREDVQVQLILPEIVEPSRLLLNAREEGTGGAIRRDLVWSLYDRDGLPVFEGTTGPRVETEVMPGRYRVVALRTEDGAEVSLEFAARTDGTTVTVEFPPYAPGVTITAPDSAPAGATILVDWTGPGEKGDYITVSEPGMKDPIYVNYANTRLGPTLELVMPPTPGRYELRYVLNNGRRAIARVPIEITPVSATLEAPETAAVGSTVLVEWSGPDYQNDYIDVAPPDAKSNAYINYAYTRKGSPAEVQMPVEAGTYVLRYVMSQDRTVLATREITATDIAFSVAGPAAAVAGDTIAVEWTGGDYQNDFIAIAEVGSKDNTYVTYSYTRDGNPVQVRMPLEPGDYEIRYVVNQDRTVKARVPIRIEPAAASLSVPAEVPAGGLVTVNWEGPDYRNDFIAIAEAGAKEDSYGTYTYSREGSPLQVQAPGWPGDYEVRYIVQGVGRKVLASVPLRVTEVEAALEGPPSAPAGAEIAVAWTGPGYRNDFVAIFPKGEDHSYKVYRYTRDGGILTLKVPDTPGEYEIRYIMNQDRRALAAIPLKVE